MNDKEEVVIGYLDPIERVQDLEDEFPSYFNGLPTFMHDEQTFGTIKCLNCDRVMKMLAQLYAPLGQQHNAFRAVYIFLCLNEACQKNPKCFRVFRMQTEIQPQPFQSKNQEYILSKRNKIMAINNDFISAKENRAAFQEAQELLPTKIEANEEDVDAEVQLDEKLFSNERKIYENYVKQQAEQGEENEIDNMENFEKGFTNKADSNFLIYQHFLTEFGNHVLRYCFDQRSQPLWFSDNGVFPTDHQCKLCGRKKHFELQLNNSVLLHFEELFNQDWGILAVYSCPASCKAKDTLVEETICVQFDQQEQLGIQLSDQDAKMVKAEKKAKKAKQSQPAVMTQQQLQGQSQPQQAQSRSDVTKEPASNEQKSAKNDLEQPGSDSEDSAEW